MKIKENKIKELEQLGFKKGLYYYSIQIDLPGTSFLRVNIQNRVMDLNYKGNKWVYSMVIPDIIVKMFKEGWIEE